MTKTFTFPACWVHINLDARFLHTSFPDGACLESVPDPNKDCSTAQRYGYGDDILALWREHDILHHWVGAHFGHGCSPTIWAEAHPTDPTGIPRWARLDEERFLEKVHRWLNLGEWHEDLHAFSPDRAEAERILEDARQLLQSITSD